MARVKLRKLPDGLYSIRVVRSRLRERPGGRATVGRIGDIADVVLERLPGVAPIPIDARDAERIAKVYNTTQ